VWLKQPLVNAADIAARLDVVEALAGDATLRDGVRDALRGEARRGGARPPSLTPADLARRVPPHA
jgi:hypothetical protein